MAGIPVILDTCEFPNKAVAKVFFKKMLAQYKVGARVSKEDQKHLLALLPRHSDYKVLMVGKFSHFETMMTPETTKCFRIIREDGSGDRFSFYHCVDNEPNP